MLKVIRFFGHWCGPCKVLAPQVEKVKETNPNVEFIDVDVDKDEEGLTAKYGIMGVPAVVFIKDGEVVDRFSGFRPAEQIQEIVDKYK
jgi:thioredoxin 1